MRGPSLSHPQAATLSSIRVATGYHAAVLKVAEDGKGVAFSAASHMPTITAADMYITAGKWQYEVLVTRAGRAVLGWTLPEYEGSWEAFQGVGACAASWGFGFDGRAPAASHDGKAHAYGAKWSYGDVIGVAVDVEAGTLTYALNGVVVEPFGVVLPLSVNVPRGSWLAPAVSYRADFSGVLNLGASSFAFPLPGFAPISSFK